MNRKRAKLVVIIFIMFTMLVTVNLYKTKHKDNILINNNNLKQFAVYIKNENGNFEEYKDNSNRLFPDNYVLNLKESKCNYADSTNPISPITTVLSSDGRTVTVKSNKTVYCTLYFEHAFAEMLSYDNKISKSKCSDIQCALDDLYLNSHKLERDN